MLFPKANALRSLVNDSFLAFLAEQITEVGAAIFSPTSEYNLPPSLIHLFSFNVDLNFFECFEP